MYHESMKARMDALEASKAAITLRINEAQFQEVAHELSRAQIRNFLARYSDIREMPPEQQKQAVELFVDRVVVYDDYVDMDILTPFGLGKARGKPTEDRTGVGIRHNSPRLHQCIPTPYTETVRIDIKKHRHR